MHESDNTFRGCHFENDHCNHTLGVIGNPMQFQSKQRVGSLAICLSDTCEERVSCAYFLKDGADCNWCLKPILAQFFPLRVVILKLTTAWDVCLRLLLT